MSELTVQSEGFIDRIEQELVQAIVDGQMVALDIEPVHHFVKKEEGGLGVYAREIRVPAGTSLTGKIHRTDHLNILSHGTMTVWHDNEERMTISAPYTFISKAGARRFGYAHTDCVWTTIHGTNETDLDKLEEELIIAPVELNKLSPCLG
jgi:hypothetical protein